MSDRRLLDNVEYLEIQTQLSTYAGLAALMDGDKLEAFVQTARRALDIGPILDPTSWMRGRERLEKIIDLAVAFQKLRFTALDLQEVVARTEEAP